jgi:hypothetical protein
VIEVGKRYTFNFKDVIEKDTMLHRRGKVLEYQHPLVKVQDIDGKEHVLNLASSQFIECHLSP